MAKIPGGPVELKEGRGPAELDALRTPAELKAGTCGREVRTRTGVYRCGLVVGHKTPHRCSTPGFLYVWREEEE